MRSERKEGGREGGREGKKWREGGTEGGKERESMFARKNETVRDFDR